jgi:hypothetical protein
MELEVHSRGACGSFRPFSMSPMWRRRWRTSGTRRTARVRPMITAPPATRTLAVPKTALSGPAAATPTGASAKLPNASTDDSRDSRSCGISCRMVVTQLTTNTSELMPTITADATTSGVASGTARANSSRANTRAPILPTRSIRCGR